MATDMKGITKRSIVFQGGLCASLWVGSSLRSPVKTVAKRGYRDY